MRFLQRLIGEADGAVALFVAAGIIALVAAVGLATDAARAYMVKSRLSQGLDAAALAGGRVMFSPTRDDDIRMYFAANFPAGFMDATVSGPTIVADPAGEVIALNASATIPTTFLRVIGVESVTVSAEAEATREMQMLDVVVAIDMSGSMRSSAGNGQSRIEAARAAATELVEILFGDAAQKDLLKIGLVPWNGKVNATVNGQPFDPGATAPVAVAPFTNPLNGSVQTELFYVNDSPVPLLSPPPADWQGCVYSRYLDDGDASDDADIALGDLSAAAGDWKGWQPIGAEGEPVPGSALCTGAVWGSECRPCLDHGVTPLQNGKQAILDAIAELTNPTGTTNIPQGLGWAWRVLMPSAPFTEAEANPPTRRRQAIVLLTDGEDYGGSGDGYKAIWGIGSAARPAMDDRLRRLAEAIKASGVLIYAIQFANGGGAQEALMREIASGPDAPYYFFAPDGDTLRRVFREIADNLSELRLSK